MSNRTGVALWWGGGLAQLSRAVAYSWWLGRRVGAAVGRRVGEGGCGQFTRWSDDRWRRRVVDDDWWRRSNWRRCALLLLRRRSVAERRAGGRTGRWRSFDDGATMSSAPRRSKLIIACRWETTVIRPVWR